MAGMESVKVYIYDLSKGMARSMSAAFLGKQIDGVWHTGIVVYGQEFFYGGMGVESCTPGQLQILGQPDEVVEVGKTEIPFEVFMDHLKDLSTTTFRGSCYHLLDHNCNTFSNEVAQFLTGNPIPSHITSLPQEVLNTPLGAMLRPMIDAMQVSPGGTPMFETPSPQAAAQQPSSASSQSIKPTQGMTGNEYFPKTTFLSFDTANVPAILGKVKEFSYKVDGCLAVEAGEIDGLQELVDGSSYHSDKLTTLLKLLKWPADLLFPVLDILRLSVRHAEVNQYLCGKKRSQEYLDLMITQMSHDQLPANQMLALRTLCNTFSHILGRTLLTEHCKDILSMLSAHLNRGANKNLQIAASSLMLNFSVIFNTTKDLDSLKLCLETYEDMCIVMTDTEAQFRLLVGIGTMLTGLERDGYSKANGDSQLTSFVQKCTEVKEPTKVADCAKIGASLCIESSSGGTSERTKQSYSEVDGELQPASFWDNKVCEEFKVKQDTVLQGLTDSQKSLVLEMHEYLTTPNCSWTPGRSHLSLIELILKETGSFNRQLVHIIARFLQNLTTKVDILSQCTLDPQSRQLVSNIVLKTEEHEVIVQEILMKTLCNMTVTSAFTDSLSTDVQGSPAILTRPALCLLCKEGLLTADSLRVNGAAAALTYNLLQSQLSDDTVTDLGMALVQTCTNKVEDMCAKYCLHSLKKCVQRNSEVASLAAVMEIKINDFAKNDSSLENVKKWLTHAIQNVS